MKVSVWMPVEVRAPPRSPNAQTSRPDVGGATTAGRTDYAITLHEQNLADRERVLGPDHPETPRTRNNLALAYLAAGRTAETDGPGQQPSDP